LNCVQISSSSSGGVLRLVAKWYEAAIAMQSSVIDWSPAAAGAVEIHLDRLFRLVIRWKRFRAAGE
jgi:hypothetical protein